MTGGNKSRNEWCITNYLYPGGTKEIMVDKVVDKEDTTQMEAVASKGDKEDLTQAVMEVKEGREVTILVGVEVKEGREDIILDKMEALEVKEVTTQEVVATKADKVDKEVTTLETMDKGIMVDKEGKKDKEGTTQVGMGTKEEARVVTTQEEVVTMMEKGEMVTIQADLGMRKGTLKKR